MSQFTFHPVTPERWPDLDALFRPDDPALQGEPAICWCMEWRIPRDEWEAGRGEGNRRAMRAVIESGTVPGLLAYAGGSPVGWCAIAPRRELSGLKAVGQYRNFEDPGYWLVSCFYISEPFRGQGLMSALLEAAVSHAKEHGARVIEGYPIDEQTEDPGGLYMGSGAVFRKLAFVEVARGAGNRAVMRLRLEGKA